MSDDIIKKIELKLGGKTITLTPEEAKQLKVALNELFGREVVKEIHHHDYPPYWYWQQPVWTSQTYGTAEPMPKQSPTIWCSDSSVGASFSDGTLSLSMQARC